MGSLATSNNTDLFLDLVKARRTFYPLNKKLTIPTSRIETIVSEALQHVPSSFNSQSNRAVILFGAEHDKLWDITRDILKAIVPVEQWQSTADKMAMFKAGAGTILFFEDEVPIKELQKNWPAYADKFPTFAAHSTGMLQFAVWTALESEGLGANLQHYSPLIDARVAEEWKIPSTWQLTAQMVFGGRSVPDAGEKKFGPLEEKFKVFGA
ncbi:Nitroreductase-like protein [Parathielavia appendiculata]|uniref:Nitroreductase-like protein n=1 Tax=Parathielavia appendiculata TaxID=2587402 RepID=A0AAN6Z733_9PEZI|nr:Nitroreductase-like protein [Parathielavia appendiculata]